MILIVIDTLRKDHMQLYGYDKRTTPNLVAASDRFVVFDDAVVQGNWTLPSVASIHTSLYPSSHKFLVMYDRDIKGHTEVGTTVLNPDVVTLAEALKSEGYRTADFQTNRWLSPETGITQGFDETRWLIPDRGRGFPAGRVNDEAIEWLEEHEGGPFFLYLHYIDPHAPYEPPPGYAERFREDEPDIRPRDRFEAPEFDYLYLKDSQGRVIRDLNQYLALYDGLISYTDEELGRLLRYLDESGVTQRAVLVIVSDHGEEFLDDGGWEHGFNLTQYMVSAPLLMRFPEGYSGTVQQRVSAVDIAPTLLDYLGLDSPPGFQGRSLMPDVRGEGRAQPRFVYSEGNGIGTPEQHVFGLDIIQKAVYSGRYKLIYTISSGVKELYDLEADPNERVDLAARMPELVDELTARIESFVEYTEANSVSPETINLLDEQEQQRLKALGYLN